MTADLAETLLYLHPNANWATYGDTYADIVWPEQETPKPTEEEVEAARVPAFNAMNLRILRRDRDARLAETDWMANSDVTMSDEWRAYRQALRDLPANTTDPANPVWPTKPE